jgi:hypothetical protein
MHIRTLSDEILFERLILVGSIWLYTTNDIVPIRTDKAQHESIR